MAGAKFRLLQCVAVTIAVSTPALAADWSLKFGSSESLTLDDNIGLGEIERDTALSSSTAFNLNLLAKAKTYTIEFTPAVSVQKTFFNQNPTSWGYFPSATLALGKTSKLTTYDLVSAISREAASTNELIDGIVTSNKGDKLTYSVRGSISHRLSDRDTLTWSNSANMTDYTLASTSLVPSSTLSSSATWNRLLTELVTADLSGSAEYYKPDSLTVDGRIVYRTSASLNAKLTKRLSVSGMAGAVFLDPEGLGLTADMVFRLGADYKLKDTGFSLSAERNISPSQNGSLLDSYSTRFSVSHQVNDLVKLGMSGSYSFQYAADNTKSSALSLSPSISYQLAKDWSSTLSYRFIQSDSPTTSAHSNAVTLNLSYGTTLLP